MEITASILSKILGGRVEGNADVKVHGPSKIEEGIPGTISFLGNPKYEPYAYTTKSSILLVSNDFIPQKPIAATLIRVKDVYASVAKLLEKFGERVEQKQAEIASSAKIHPTAKIGKEVSIGEYCIIEENVIIDEGTYIDHHVVIKKGTKIGRFGRIETGVKIYHDCELGDYCTIKANAIIGSDGFGFAPQADGSYKKVPQLGIVKIGNNVSVGANTTIDRATMGATTIADGVKLDNLIQVAHNVEIGENTVIASQTGIAGSTKIGKNCMVGGQVGFAGHLKIADGTKIQAQSGLGQSVKKENTALFGTPAIDYKDYVRSFIIFKQLPTLEKAVRKLKDKLGN